MIAREENRETNLGSIEVRNSAPAENLSSLIKPKLSEFGRRLELLNFFMCDGAQLNFKVGRITYMEIILCMNHRLHLGKFLKFYFISNFNIKK